MALDRMRSVTGLTALAGGGQTGATELYAQAMNLIETVATAADSALLPTAINGMSLVVINAGANSTTIYPRTSETINALAANAGLAVAAGKQIDFRCPKDGKWYSHLSA
jgi:poly(3-hydroxybutyrate) depolymerase